MTKDEILTKAWEVGLIYKQDNTWLFDRHPCPSESILLFAEELILAEREACAKVCDEAHIFYDDAVDSRTLEICAAAIRAREQA